MPFNRCPVLIVIAIIECYNALQSKHSTHAYVIVSSCFTFTAHYLKDSFVDSCWHFGVAISLKASMYTLNSN